MRILSQEKGFRIISLALTLPITSCNFKAIQGHSGGNAIDPELQDNVLLPEDLLSTSTMSGM